MTNTPSGSKRPHDGGSPDSEHKRRRENHEPRDWRDVHLRAGGAARQERRGSADSRYRDHGDRNRSRDRPRERDYDRRRGREYSRDRGGRRRDERDRSRERDRRYHDRERGRGDHRHREDERRRTTTASPRTSLNGHPRPAKDHISDKEEGEISPQPTREPSPPRTRIGKGLPSETAPAPPPAVQPATKPPPAPEPELELSISPVPLEVTLAQRRAKRQAILAKYGGVASVTTTGASPSPGPSSAVQPPQTPLSISNSISQSQSILGTPRGAAVSPGVESAERTAQATPRAVSPSASPTPAVFDLTKEAEEEETQAVAQAEQRRDGGQEQISAADYDPSLDRREDEERRVRGNGEPARDVETIEEEEEEEEEELEDMFALVTSVKKKKVKKVKKVVKPAAPALITTMLDSASDSEGYYQIILGEQLDGGKYQVFSSLGKGMFANVVRARVLQGDPGEIGREVAIKIIRSQESMHKAGLKEVQILNKLKQADPEDKKHIVRLERTFEHRGHLCLVFESLSMNLRDVVKRFGKDVGLNIRAVRAYAHQLFLALSLLKKCNVMHADIKPDNILVNEQKTLIKLCDLGSASDASENEITPYLVSRFYRAPEIILGIPYDPALDIWSIGCTLYELYTGKILFPGRSNNQMLHLMMDLKGRFNSKMIKKAKFGDVYFDDMGGFQSVEKDRVTGGDIVRTIHVAKPARDLRQRLMPSASVQLKDDERKLLMSFVDLLDKCLALDPARRITPKEALVHPFIRG